MIIGFLRVFNIIFIFVTQNVNRCSATDGITVLIHMFSGPSLIQFQAYQFKRRMSAPLTYYNNRRATFQINLIVYGDVEPNPGPSSDNNNELKTLYLNARSVKSVT